jgi:hypothetical protein
VSKDLGGINLNPTDKALQVKNSGGGDIKFKLDPAMLEELRNAPGFVPVIINVQPLKDLPMFLGLSDDSSDSPQVAAVL